MRNPAPSTPEQIAEACALLEELGAKTGADIFDVLDHVLLQTDYFNAKDDEVLAWFPRGFLTEAIAYLKDVQRACAAADGADSSDRISEGSQ